MWPRECSGAGGLENNERIVLGLYKSRVFELKHGDCAVWLLAVWRLEFRTTTMLCVGAVRLQ